MLSLLFKLKSKAIDIMRHVLCSSHISGDCKRNKLYLYHQRYMHVSVGEIKMHTKSRRHTFQINELLKKCAYAICQIRVVVYTALFIVDVHQHFAILN